MDCGGSVRNVLYKHDIIILRDASQQAKGGQRVEITPDFSNLQPGDLIFFGAKATAEKGERVSHVGISLGGAKFIHSQGYIYISSFLPEDEEYDEFNLNRLLYAQRVLPYLDREPQITTTLTNEFYQY